MVQENNKTENNPLKNIANAEVSNKGYSWFIWLLPAIAAIVGVWLIYQSVVNAGVKVTIHFPAGSNILAHKTELRYEGMVFGTVESVRVSDDLSGLLVDAELARDVGHILQEDTMFWVVHPHVSAAKVSGLDTLMSGNYITLQLGEETGRLDRNELQKLKPVKYDYMALAKPPAKPDYLGGVHIILSSTLDSRFNLGAPVVYQSFDVGEIDAIDLAEDNKSTRLSIFIYEKYKHLVTKKSRFWDVSGISVKGSIGDLDVNIASLTTMLIGGLEFSNMSEGSTAAENGDQYKLYGSYQEAISKATDIKIHLNSGNGVKVGTEIRYKGIAVGKVVEVNLDSDFKGVTLRAQLLGAAGRFANKGSQFWIVKPQLGLVKTTNLDTLIGGRYISVEPGEGKRHLTFEGLERRPAIKAEAKGLKIVLTTPRLGSIKAGTKIYYRNVPIGEILGVELAANAQKVLLHSIIYPGFEQLAYENSVFWNISGLDISVGLFSGAKIESKSMESYMEGGIAMATPNNSQMGRQAKSGHTYPLQIDMTQKDRKKWLSWSPVINIRESTAVKLNVIKTTPKAGGASGQTSN